MGKDVEIQQGVSIAEIAQIYPVHFPLRRNDVAGIEVSVQTGGCRLQFVHIACQPFLDIVRNHLVSHNHFPGTQGEIVKSIRIAGDGVKGLGIFCRNAGQFIQPFGMVCDNPSKRLLALDSLDSHAVTLPVGNEFIRFGRWNPHLKDSLGAKKLLLCLAGRNAGFIEFKNHRVVRLVVVGFSESSPTKGHPLLKVDDFCFHSSICSCKITKICKIAYLSLGSYELRFAGAGLTVFPKSVCRQTVPQTWSLLSAEGRLGHSASWNRIY